MSILGVQTSFLFKPLMSFCSRPISLFLCIADLIIFEGKIGKETHSNFQQAFFFGPIIQGIMIFEPLHDWDIQAILVSKCFWHHSEGSFDHFCPPFVPSSASRLSLWHCGIGGFPATLLVSVAQPRTRAPPYDIAGFMLDVLGVAITLWLWLTVRHGIDGP